MAGEVSIHAGPRTPAPMLELTWPLKCRVCGSVMILEDPHRMDGHEAIRARCIKNCRGSDIYQERRTPGLPQTREFDWHSEAKKAQQAHNNFLFRRTLTCQVCLVTVTGKFHPRAETCSKEHSEILNKIRAHERWLKIKKERAGKWKRRKK